MDQGAPMTYPTRHLNGITPDDIKLLRSVGIRTTERLLDAACTVPKRKALAAKTGVSEQQWLCWANNADRLRIKGIGQDNATLLQAAGVVTVRDLRSRNPRHLAQRMHELNGKRKLVRLPPTENAIKRWIEAAKKLDQKIKY
jgi:predicted RecB family nuclease